MVKANSLPVKIAITGRPNVGKSTLFNRLVGRKIAIVHDEAGVTRDRRVHPAKLHDLRFDVIDTAGLDEGAPDSLSARMREQTKLAIDQADIILFLFDAKIGITILDEKFANLLRKANKPIILVGNKTESRHVLESCSEIWRLGFDSFCAISAEHGLGMSDLRDVIAEKIEILERSEASELQPEVYFERHEDSAPSELSYEDTYSEVKACDDILRLAIVGRPNVGKSTFINSLLGEDRLLTGPEAGITRDSISLDWTWRGHNIKLFDTAGIRRRSRLQGKLEKLSVTETLQAIKFSQIVVVMFDATQAFEKQDLHIVDLIIKEGRAPVLAFNKWDLIEDKQAFLSKLYEKTARLLPQVKGLRAVPICALQSQGADKLMENVMEVFAMWNKRISTAMLNRWLISATGQNPPPLVGKRRLKLKYITQVRSAPPTFVLYCSTITDQVSEIYIRYLINSIRVNFDIWGVPIRLFIRSSNNPYINKKQS